MEEEYFSCQCNHFGHTIRVLLDPLDGDLRLETRLSCIDPWYKRLWIAVKYVLGSQVSYGNYDDVLLKDEDYDRFHSMMLRSRLIKAVAANRLEHHSRA